LSYKLDENREKHDPWQCGSKVGVSFYELSSQNVKCLCFSSTCFTAQCNPLQFYKVLRISPSRLYAY
jgi:hypothetical protein